MNLCKALQIVTKVRPESSSSIILHSVHFGPGYVEATNLETALRVLCPDSQVECVLPLEEVKSVFKVRGPISIAAGKGGFTLTCGAYQSTVSGLPVDAYPTVGVLNAKTRHEVGDFDAATWTRAVERCAPCVSKDFLGVCRQSLCLEVHGARGQAAMIATNGHVLTAAALQTGMDAESKRTQYILPGSVAPLATLGDGERVHVEADATHIQCTCGDVTLWTGLVEGTTYPTWRGVAYPHPVGTLRLNVAALSTLLRAYTGKPGEGIMLAQVQDMGVEASWKTDSDYTPHGTVTGGFTGWGTPPRIIVAAKYLRLMLARAPKDGDLVFQGVENPKTLDSAYYVSPLIVADPALHAALETTVLMPMRP